MKWMSVIYFNEPSQLGKTLLFIMGFPGAGGYLNVGNFSQIMMLIYFFLIFPLSRDNVNLRSLGRVEPINITGSRDPNCKLKKFTVSCLCLFIFYLPLGHICVACLDFNFCKEISASFKKNILIYFIQKSFKN